MWVFTFIWWGSISLLMEVISCYPRIAGPHICSSQWVTKCLKITLIYIMSIFTFICHPCVCVCIMFSFSIYSHIHSSYLSPSHVLCLPAEIRRQIWCQTDCHLSSWHPIVTAPQLVNPVTMVAVQRRLVYVPGWKREQHWLRIIRINGIRQQGELLSLFAHMKALLWIVCFAVWM